LTRNVLDVQKPGLKGRTRWTQSGCGFGRPRPVTVSPSGLGGSGGGCIFRERGDWRVFLLEGMVQKSGICIFIFYVSSVRREHKVYTKSLLYYWDLNQATKRSAQIHRTRRSPTQNVVVMKLAAALLLSCCGQRQSPPTPAPHVARSRPGAASDSAENRRIQPRRCSWRTNHRENPPAGCPCSGP
jgi:hypothetical protein